MDYFNYRQNQLFAEDVAVQDIAEQYGTPCYVYSRATLERHYHAYQTALQDYPHLICYAVKANSNLAVLNVLARLGAGFDIVSQGELERVLAAGGSPDKVVFSGVGKQAGEIRRALEVGVHCFNIESEAELGLVEQVAAECRKKAPISLRVNPDVDAQTHPYISTGLKENKFGIDIDVALELYRRAAKSPHLEVMGIDCHIGSQLTQIAPFLDALDRVLATVRQLAAEGIPLRHLDLGGGLGVTYNEESPPHPTEYAAAVLDRMKESGLTLVLEPGRSIAANAGIMLTRVEFLKDNGHKHFAIVDAAMNDLIRPSLYGAWQNIIPVQPHQEGTEASFDIVGPVCETGDFIGKDRLLNLKPGDLLAVRSAGAYGFTMSSNYNSRARAAEVMVDGNETHLIRRRETLQELYAAESLLPDASGHSG
ncbi:diaminopimelate decarboxylase [Hahella sp. CCB-MM4]|uniref:diaminopimelate decarboxylase n=1 Tax=Hahella sp. (strain CCB-MM4) TaxID=1926491 RepID=UPI000B9C557F|nr:diaminopimelate decarboxylase [Hahella sp. CCB-MM4]OZG74631.1 diaminopimelate decarboxylase [Hahella sp. CCB-MM4]